MYRLTIILLCLSLNASCLFAQTGNGANYTEEKPLVYEDAQNLWPYAFLDDNGHPAGFNIDLMKLLMEELHLPYTIQLKPLAEVIADLKANKADLTFSQQIGFHGMFGHYSRNAIALFTQSVATPNSKPVAIRHFRDLEAPNLKVTVHDSSLCHRLMVDYGWADHAIVSDDISKAIRQLNDKQEGQILWNTLSLRWLKQHYQLDHITLTPVDMPHADYRLLSNDQQLIELLDKAYASLKADGKLEPIEAKWLYPDHEQPKDFHWRWYMAIAALLLLLAVAMVVAKSLMRNKHITAAHKELSRQLAQTCQDNNLRIWTYDVTKEAFVWHDENGTAGRTYPREEFAKRYNKEDYLQLKEALDRLINRHKDAKGHVESEETLELKAWDTDGGDGELHDFVVVLDVLSRDHSGKPSVIICTKKDVTNERRLRKLNNNRSLRYWSMFYNDESGVIMFDSDGTIQNANPKACELFGCDIDKMVKEHVDINTLFHTTFTTLQDCDGYQGSLEVGQNHINYQMKTVSNDDGKLLGIYVFCL